MSSSQYLHHHPEFAQLLGIVAEQRAIAPELVEKDYWLMHCLFGLQQLELKFELKGGTSLSKGFGLIHRFSEDIDIRIDPPPAMKVAVGKNQNSAAHCASRANFYDWLATFIEVDGVVSAIRDKQFDDEKSRSGGIRLLYESLTQSNSTLKAGILLEVGFDDVTPNVPKNISSWAYDFAATKIPLIDNRAVDVPCYHAGFTLVEKLQAISTKYRRQQASGQMPENFMRHYYDVFCLLQVEEIQSFIGSAQYLEHKKRRFRGADNPIIAENEAFRLSDTETRRLYESEYRRSSGLYYRSQPEFAVLLETIQRSADRL